MTKQKTLLLVLGSVAGVALLVVGGGYGHHLYRQWDNTRDRLPEFTEPPPGARAPAGAASLWGLDVGRTTVADVDAWQQARGVHCDNTSMRALMQKKREDTQQAMKDAEARGEDPDGVTGASAATYHSKKEKNPQVRLACNDVEGKALGDAPDRPARKGRVLVIFDSAQLPVRHLSFAALHGEPSEAFAAYTLAVDELTRKLGPPTAALGGDPVEGEPFPTMKLYKKTWTFSDVKAEVQALGFGTRGVDVKETLEVPWPVRPDAPAR